MDPELPLSPHMVALAQNGASVTSHMGPEARNVSLVSYKKPEVKRNTLKIDVSQLTLKNILGDSIIKRGS